MSEGVDYSFSRPGGASLAGADKGFAVRYLWPYTDGSKGINQAEHHDLTSHGLDVALVYEEDGRELLGGYNSGVSIGHTIDSLLAQFGYAKSTTVYAAVDFDAQGSDLDAINEGLRGLAAVRGKSSSGIYGGIGTIRAAQSAGHIAYFWQTYAWSGGQLADGVHLYQYSNGENINGSVDYTRSLADNYGQNGLTAGGTQPAPEEEKEMSNNAQIQYRRSRDNTVVKMLFNTQSGFYNEFIDDSKNSIAAGFAASGLQTGSVVGVGEGERNAIVAGLERIAPPREVKVESDE